MFRASSARLQEDTVVYMQHMVLSLSMRVPGGLSVHSLSENCLWGGGKVGRASIHAPGGIRTCNPSKRATAGPRLRPRGRWDRYWSH